MTQAAIKRKPGSRLAESAWTWGYHLRAPASPRATRSPSWASACWVLCGTDVSVRYSAISLSVSGRPNHVWYQKRKVTRTSRNGTSATIDFPRSTFAPGHVVRTRASEFHAKAPFDRLTTLSEVEGQGRKGMPETAASHPPRRTRE